MWVSRVVPSPLGEILLCAEGEALKGLWFSEGRQPEEITGGREVCVGSLSVLEDTARWLETYFSGKDPGDPPPCRPEGSPFDCLVWSILLTIPYGKTRTYGEVAREAALLMGKERMSAQAVGGAVGRNPISLVVPCHRVMGAGGKLTGYGWGLEKKAALLRLEGIAFKA